jgi:hypothetical protein
MGVRDVVPRAHGARDVVLVVEPIGGEADGAAGGDFFDEHNAAAQAAVGKPANVVTQIDFHEPRVPGNGKAEQARAVKAKADDAEVGLAVV